MMTGSYPGRRCEICLNYFYVIFYSAFIFSLYISRVYTYCMYIIFAILKLQVKDYLKKEFERHGYSPNDTHHEVMLDDIFKNEDDDKDGFISAREFVHQHDEL